MSEYESQTLERPVDAGKGPRGIVRRWLMELEIADKEEKDWRKSAHKVIDRYRSEDTKNEYRGGEDARFNILWANTELMRPSLYSQTPNPDIRRRHRQEDEIGRSVADALEKVCTYVMDESGMDESMELAVLDLLLPGRAVTRVRYVPLMLDGMLANEKIEFEHVQWDRFRRSPGSKWSDVNWIAFEHFLNRTELDAQYGKAMSKNVELDVKKAGAGDQEGPDEDELFERARVWEIWDRDARQVIHIAPCYKDAPLRVDDDPLRLARFYPIAPPLYALRTSNTLVPVELYRMYRAQADELDLITARIDGLTSSLKFRGIYDSTVKEMSRILEGPDNEFIPSESALAALANVNRLDDVIWTVPIDTIAGVLVQLEQRRDAIKQTIYEITGISDILRGATNPNETLGAQQLKAQTGSLRLQRQQRDVANYARNLLEIVCELVAMHYQPQTIEMMIGEPIDPMALQLIRDQGLREYRIDVETDSTIAVDHQADQEAISGLLTGVVDFINGIGPAVESGYVPANVAQTMLVAAVRRFRLGREVEEALDTIGNEQDQPEAPTPEQLQMMQEQMQEEAMMQAQQAMAGEQEQLKLERAALDVQQKDAEADLAVAQADIKMQRREVAAERREAEIELARKLADIKQEQFGLTQLDGKVAEGMSQLDARDNETVEKEQRLDEVEQHVEKMAEAIAMLAQVMAQGIESQAKASESLLAALSAPKELVRDPKTGRPTGVRTALNS